MSKNNFINLRVLCGKDNIMFALEQKNLNKSFFISPYYIWPKTNAWDLLNLEFNSRPWISENEKIELLNITTDIMNLWREAKLSNKEIKVKNLSPKVDFVLVSD